MTSIPVQIVSGATKVTFTAPNKFSYRLARSYTSGDKDTVSLKSQRMYYSWRNVTAAKDNTKYSYTWHDGTVVNVEMPDGIYSYADFQGYLEAVMQTKGHYLLDENSQPVYYIRFESNPVYYRISLTVSPIPASLPSGYTAPTGWSFPAAAVTPQVTIPATNIRSYLGFDAGTYPAATQATKYQVNGTAVPQVTDVSSLMIQCNLVRNQWGPSHQTLAAFNIAPGTAPGSMVSEVPYYEDRIQVQPSVQFETIDVELVDQNGRPVIIEDTAGFITMLTIHRGN